MSPADAPDSLPHKNAAAIRDLEGRVSAVEAKAEGNATALELQRDSMHAFWNTHWPALMRRIDDGTSALVRLDERVDDLHLQLWKLIAALAASGVMGGASTAGLLKALGLLGGVE